MVLQTFGVPDCGQQEWQFFQASVGVNGVPSLVLGGIVSIVGVSGQNSVSFQ